MRKDDAYLEDINIAAKQIAEFIKGRTKSEFLSDLMCQAAVVRQLEIIGEASSRLTQALKDLHPEVPWKRLTNLRNLYIHAYHAVNYEKVWTSARTLAPRVQIAVEALIPPEDAE